MLEPQIPTSIYLHNYIYINIQTVKYLCITHIHKHVSVNSTYLEPAYQVTLSKKALDFVIFSIVFGILVLPNSPSS
jgi:hypothetical protein